MTFATTFVTRKVHRKRVRVPTGFTVTMRLGDAPGPETFYRVYASSSVCGTLFIEYGTDLAAGGARSAACRTTSPHRTRSTTSPTRS